MGHRSSAVRLAVGLAAAGCALLVGCSTSVAGTAAPDPSPRPTSGPGADPVVWSDRVCDSLLSYYGPLKNAPNYAGAGSPVVIRDRLTGYLGQVMDGIRRGQDQMRSVGPSPVAGGDALTKSINDLLAKAAPAFAAAKSDVDSADPQNPADVERKLNSAQDKLKAVSGPAGLEKIGATPRLDKAVEAAPKCRQLKTVTGQR